MRSKARRDERAPEARARSRACSRRAVMARWGGALAAFAMPGGAIPSLGAARAPGRSENGAASTGFRIGACDWSLGLPGDPDALRLAAELGLDGVQASFGEPGGADDLRRAEARAAWKEAEGRHGTRVASLGLGVLNSVPYASDPRAEDWVREAVDVAATMGLRVVLLAFFGKGDIRGDAAAQREVVRRLRRVAPRAEERGVVLGLESWLDAGACLRMLEAVDSPSVAVYYDLGNSRHRGYDVPAEIRRLGRERICEIHAKDYAGKLFGQGEVDFWAVRETLDAIGWRGWIQIEARTPFGRERSYRHDARFLRALFPRNG